ncbi:unnamed protein product [Camellia sinensis]
MERMGFCGSNSILQPTSTNQLRNPSMTGGYSLQGSWTSWAPPAPPMQQQPGYGYMQPGALVILLKQHRVVMLLVGTRQLVHLISGRLREALTITIASRLSSSKPLQPAPTDNTSYGYGQPPASGYSQQGYTLGGYGGYAPALQTGYGQPSQLLLKGMINSKVILRLLVMAGTTQAPPPVQSQQGYDRTQPPSTNTASYPTQGSTQPGYGVPTSQPSCGTQPASGYGPKYGPPQAQKPPAGQAAYGQQPQQSPGAQGGYAQPGYPQSQPPPAAQAGGYAQPDSGAQWAPPSGYGASAAQPGYGSPPYGAPPVTQPGYGQQQLPYNSSYGGGYSQPPAYSACGAPTSQAVQPGGVAKASPKS